MLGPASVHSPFEASAGAKGRRFAGAALNMRFGQVPGPVESQRIGALSTRPRLPAINWCRRTLLAWLLPSHAAPLSPSCLPRWWHAEARTRPARRGRLRLPLRLLQRRPPAPRPRPSRHRQAGRSRPAHSRNGAPPAPASSPGKREPRSPASVIQPPPALARARNKASMPRLALTLRNSLRPCDSAACRPGQARSSEIRLSLTATPPRILGLSDCGLR